MIYERLILMRDLLRRDGSIYLHCDWRVNAFIRLVMDEVFGGDGLQNEIIWKRQSAHSDAKLVRADPRHNSFLSRAQTITLGIRSSSLYSDDYIRNLLYERRREGGVRLCAE